MAGQLGWWTVGGQMYPWYDMVRVPTERNQVISNFTVLHQCIVAIVRAIMTFQFPCRRQGLVRNEWMNSEAFSRHFITHRIRSGDRSFVRKLGAAPLSEILGSTVS